MQVPHGLFLLAGAMVLSPIARADTPIQIDQVTAYAGNCQYDKQGGGTQSSSGTDVTQHTVEKAQGGGTFAIAAMPQSGGSSGAFKCEFTDEQNFPGVTFHADDHYGKGSDGKLKYDAAHDCTPQINSQSKPATTIQVKGNCGSQQGGAGDKIQRI